MTELNVNSRLLGGKSVEETNSMIAKYDFNLPQTLRKAVIHECGHAKAYYRKSVKDIYIMNDTLKSKGVDGVSPIASIDGAECIAEVEVLLSRGATVPDEAMLIYNKYVKGISK